MLTTTVDGLWALQALTGIEVLGPELGLRPLLPHAEPPRLALRHPAAAELAAAGVIDGSGAVTPTVVEWLTVLARRDVAVFIQLHTPADGAVPAGVLLARYARWWAVLERRQHTIRLCGVGRAGDPAAAHGIVTTQVERLCGSNDPAPLRPVALPAEVLAATSLDALRAKLRACRIDADQLRLLATAADPLRSARASIVAIQSGVDGAPARTHIEAGAVSIIDTPEGRVATEQLDRDGQRWLLIGPGTTSGVAAGITRMLRRLPAHRDWYSYRKAV